MAKHALFEGLIFNEDGQPVQTAEIGGEPYYAISDDDFLRHVEARSVDLRVMTLLRDAILTQRELVTEQILQVLGKDDLFTKAMIDSALQNLDKQVDQMAETGLPEDARMWLGAMGFRVIVDLHGEVVDVHLPAQEMPEE